MSVFRRLLSVSLGIALSGFVHHASAQSQANLCVIGTNATTTVSSSNALRSALSNAGPGTTIVVKGGSYSGDFTLSKSGKSSAPITIRAGGNVTFKSSVFTLKGAYGVLTGMTFDNGMVTVEGNYNRVTRNVFKNGKTTTSTLHSAVHTFRGAKYNRIDHNEVVNWQRRALRSINLRTETKGNRFDYNYVHKMLGERANSGEAFQVGTADKDTVFFPGTIFEYNLVDGHNIESEVVSLKANGNILRGNTFMNASTGNVNSRMGAKNEFINNTLININSMRMYGDDNEVIGNQFVKTDLEVRSGDVLLYELSESTKYKGGHPAARNTIVVGNQFSGGNIILGRKGTGSHSYPRTFPAEKTVLALNKGAEVKIDGAVKNTKYQSSYSGKIGSPIQLKPSQVGPNAADPVCDGVEAIAALPPSNLKVLAAQP